MHPITPQRYLHTRHVTDRLCAPLAKEDHVIQAMEDVSPTKWHLAHTTWFFETFLLRRHLVGYRPLDDRYQFLFNSYYNAAGPQYSRPHRGHLSRPTVEEVHAYRRHVDQGMTELVGSSHPLDVDTLTVLGLQHEQQHQELILTDIKYNLAVNPLRPAYHDASIPRGTRTENTRWESFNGGLVPLGADSDGFAFDNERPRHRVFLEPYRLATRPVTNGEFLEFLESGGYGRSDLWLSEGWAAVQEHDWTAPLYWEQIDGTWWMQTLSGMTPVDIHAPLAHVSYYEADAFARFAGCRLPTEAEWEHAAERVPLEGNFQDSGLFHPVPEEHGRARQMFGDVWEWTRSAYLPYPGFQPFTGDVGEYNGKFMISQMVLRGGSCVTAASHMRTTYRNFFHPGARWQFAGVRLAQDA